MRFFLLIFGVDSKDWISHFGVWSRTLGFFVFLWSAESAIEVFYFSPKGNASTVVAQVEGVQNVTKQRNTGSGLDPILAQVEGVLWWVGG